jgi:hypothetical protein
MTHAEQLRSCHFVIAPIKAIDLAGSAHGKDITRRCEGPQMSDFDAADDLMRCRA